MLSFHFPPPPQPITVVVASQHPVVEAGICICLSRVPYLEVLGSATHGPGLEQQLHRLKPNVVLSEIDLPGLDGIAAMELIWRQFPATSLIGHSWTQVSPGQLTALMNAGAMGFVQEPVQSAEIAQVILKVHYGHLPLPLAF